MLERIQKQVRSTISFQKKQLDKVVYSLLRVKDGFLARELYLRIASHEANFSDLASEYSEGNEAKTKGIIGPVPMNQASFTIRKLLTSRPGHLNEPFNIGEWWLIARLERYEPLDSMSPPCKQ